MLSHDSRYRQADALAETVGATFIQGVASLGLVAVKAACGQMHEALEGYSELLDHWERTGAWTQQWTTLRNAADLFDQLGDHDLASFLRTAADEAPEAASVVDLTTKAEPQSGSDVDLSVEFDTQHGARTREEVLAIARQAIARWLTATNER